MLFNSWEFILFVPIVFAGHAFLRGKAVKVWLVVGSYVFYGWANPWYCALLAASTALDYFVALRIQASHGQRHRRLWLAVSACGNLGILVFFKCSAFLLAIVADTAHGFSLEVGTPQLAFAVPVGLSFYTFQTLGYTIDVYRRRTTPTKDFLAFALYVAFFPQLVAGPIERANRLLPQLLHKQVRSREDIMSGVTRILCGFAKKIVLADGLGLYVDQIYGQYGSASSYELLLATYCFAFQIYLDFSAYSDIAIGLARCLGVKLSENFRWPMLSRDMTEFFSRWHVSFSTWLRDYLFLPLAGDRPGLLHAAGAGVVTCLLGGLWHGADYTFVLWGLYIGVCVMVSSVFQTRRRRPRGRGAGAFGRADIVRAFVTFHALMGSMVLFRGVDLEMSLGIYGKWLSGWSTPDFATSIDAEYAASLLLLAIGAQIVHGFGCSRGFMDRRDPLSRGLLWGLMLLAIVVFYAPSSERFVYFQF